MIIIVTKIGTGTEQDPFRPNTDAEHWQVVDEREAEFDIEILN